MNHTTSKEHAGRRSRLDERGFAPALVNAFIKLAPQHIIKNPVMAVVWLGTLVTAVATLAGWAQPGFGWAVTAILLITVLFGNFAEAVAESRGRGQAASLRRARKDLMARRLDTAGGEKTVPAAELRPGDHVVIEEGQLVPADGEIVEGLATINEAAVTGESAPVLREAGTDRSGVIGGTKVLSDRIVVRVTAEPGNSFLDRMIALVEGSNRQKTPNEIALGILLGVMTLTFLIVVVTLPFIGGFVGVNVNVVLLVALLVCLIPTTIGGLLLVITTWLNQSLTRRPLQDAMIAGQTADRAADLYRDEGELLGALGMREAAHALKLTAQDLKKLEVIDRIIPEPVGGAQRAPAEAVAPSDTRTIADDARDVTPPGPRVEVDEADALSSPRPVIDPHQGASVERD